jgi:hypothetical protein
VTVSAVLVVLTRTSVFPFTSMYATLWAWSNRLHLTAVPTWDASMLQHIKSPCTCRNPTIDVAHGRGVWCVAAIVHLEYA